ncbi:hypothetical protein [Gordonia sp. SND2]|uniref:hypothetical protein n=1 Tax=Gordonia sp. SND2 TaxID=3388659 RepID=UPI00398ACF28
MNPTNVSMTLSYTAPPEGWPAMNTTDGSIAPELIVLTVTVGDAGAETLPFVSVRGTNSRGQLVLTSGWRDDMPGVVSGLVAAAERGAAAMWTACSAGEVSAA